MSCQGLAGPHPPNMKKPRFRGVFRSTHARGNQSPSVSSEALPPAAVVFTVTVFSVAKRSR